MWKYFWFVLVLLVSASLLYSAIVTFLKWLMRTLNGLLDQLKVCQPLPRPYQPSGLYYCNICYKVWHRFGKCHEHGFPNPLKVGDPEKLEYYKKMQQSYDSADFNEPPLN